VVDTGGWEHDAKGLAAQVAAQAEVAIAAADAVLFVVDATVGPTDTDEAVVQVLRRAGKPVVLVANKVDDAKTEADAANLWSLGLGEPYPVSRCPGRGIGDLLDAVLGALPRRRPSTSTTRPVRAGWPCSAGRNVGKSSLLNQLAGTDGWSSTRAGTTRDPVDELIELGDQTWRFVDTAASAGGHTSRSGTDYYANPAHAVGARRARGAVVLIDASETLSEQDTDHHDGGRVRPCPGDRLQQVGPARRRAPVLPRARDRARPGAGALGASGEHLGPTGRHMDRLVPALDVALESWDKRVPTGRLNAFLGEVVAAHPHPIRGGKQPRILFATQGRHPATAVRAVHLGLPRGRLPAVRRAPDPRGVRLRGHTDRGQREDAGEARPLTASRSLHLARHVRLTAVR
jgi:GTP-binding protein